MNTQTYWYAVLLEQYPSSKLWKSSSMLVCLNSGMTNPGTMDIHNNDFLPKIGIKFHWPQPLSIHYKFWTALKAGSSFAKYCKMFLSPSLGGSTNGSWSHLPIIHSCSSVVWCNIADHLSYIKIFECGHSQQSYTNL